MTSLVYRREAHSQDFISGDKTPKAPRGRCGRACPVSRKFCWPPIIWRRHLFCKCFLESIPSTPLNGLYETLTHNVYWLAIEHYEETFRVLAPKKLGPKTTYFRRLCDSMATLKANISGKEHDINNREMTWKLRKVPYIVPKFYELWSITAKNKTVVFTHPLKSSSAWRRQTSRWPALRHANISSFFMKMLHFCALS